MAESNYIDSQLFPLLDKAMDDQDLWSLVGSGEESIVDGVLYLVSHTG
jgi:hypothetical protein